MDLAAAPALPPGWTVTDFGALLAVLRGVSYDKSGARSQAEDGLVPILRATNISDQLDFDDLVYVPNRHVSKEQLLQQGDIIVAASSGSQSVVGKAAPLLRDWYGAFGAFCFALRPSKEVSAKFIAYYLRTSTYRNIVSALSAGVNINNLRRHHIEDIPFLLPPLPEQARIVAEIEKQFSRLDFGIAALQRVQANLKRYRASVLQAACEGRLVPTEAELARTEGRAYEPADVLLTRILAERRARWEAEQWAKHGQPKASGRDPFLHTDESKGLAQLTLNQEMSGSSAGATAGVPLTVNEVALASETQDEAAGSVVDPLFRNQEASGLDKEPPRLFSRQSGFDPSRYKEPVAPDTTGLPELPEGWVWATAEQISDENRAITYGVVKLGEPFAKGIPTLRSSNVRHLRLDLTGVKSISPEIAKDYRRTFLKGNEVLVTVRGTLGGVVVVPSACTGYNISREVAMIATVEEKVAAFLAFFIGSTGAQRWITRNTKGIAYTGLNIETLKMMPIALPPLAEQERITAEVERILSVVDAQEIAVKASLKRAERLRQAILQQAFTGTLVPQDPADEPASALLERIRAEREAQARTPAKSDRRKEKANAEPGNDDPTGTAVPSGHARRKRGTADEARLQPDLFSANGA